VLLYLLGKGYRVLQVDNRALKDYREKIFGSETKTDETDARLMARMGFLHELVGEEFSIQPAVLMNPDAASLRAMGRFLAYISLRDGRNFGEVMIGDGYAHEYTYRFPCVYQDEFKAAQADAIANQLGLWSPTTCVGDTTQPAGNVAVAPQRQNGKRRHRFLSSRL
jgi:hypothetical protein